jgi:hypothetical protein
MRAKESSVRSRFHSSRLKINLAFAWNYRRPSTHPGDALLFLSIDLKGPALIRQLDAPLDEVKGLWRLKGFYLVQSHHSLVSSAVK